MNKGKYLLIYNLILILILKSISFTSVKAFENDDYQSYSEVILSTGKLLKDFTDEEEAECLKNTEKVYYHGICSYVENKNVPATYIANTLYSTQNTSDATVNFSIDVELETNRKVMVKFNGGISSKFGIPIDKIKAELGKKSDIEVSYQSQESKKEKKTVKIPITPNSKVIVYIGGDLSVSNGAFSYYRGFFRVCSSTYELVVLTSQYSRFEMSPVV